MCMLMLAPETAKGSPNRFSAIVFVRDANYWRSAAAVCTDFADLVKRTEFCTFTAHFCPWLLMKLLDHQLLLHFKPIIWLQQQSHLRFSQKCHPMSTGFRRLRKRNSSSKTAPRPACSCTLAMEIWEKKSDFFCLVFVACAVSSLDHRKCVRKHKKC